jgi:UDP-glucose 4-epimerase
VAEVLVIGANGFIGSHLVDGLSADGHEVTAFDRFSSSEPRFASTGVRIVQGDFLSRGDIDDVVAGQRIVMHFLSTTSPATAESDPTVDIRTNVAQTVELLEACVEAGVDHVFFASTGGAIYGSQGKSEYGEEDPAHPVSPYGIGKLTIENYLGYFRAKHGLGSTALRISNPYGPRQRNRKQGFIPIALRQIALNQPVVRFGDGSMVRDYIYVDDAVSMIRAMVHTKPLRSVYNIGSGHGHSVNEVLESLKRVTGRDFAVADRPVPPTFVDRVVLDPSRYREEFGQIPLTGLDEGVRVTWEDIRGAIHD